MVAESVGGRRTDNVVLVTERLLCAVHDNTRLLWIRQFLLGSVGTCVDFSMNCHGTIPHAKGCRLLTAVIIFSFHLIGFKKIK